MVDDLDPKPTSAASRGASVSRLRSLPPWSVDAGSPGHLVLHLLVQGSFQLSRPDGHVLDLGAGDIVGITSGANDAGESELGMRLHCAAAPLGAAEIEPGEVLSAVYAPGMPEGAERGPSADDWPSRFPTLIHLRAVEVRREQGLPAIVSLLGAELASTSREHERVAQTLLEPLLAYVQRCWRQARSGERGFHAPQPLDRRLARALALMRSRPAHPWTVEALARAAGLSRAAFARRFLAEVGTAPLRWLSDWRMQLASRLLAESDASLASVAIQVGYESEFAFSRAFKRHRGEAPGVFRRRVRAHAASFRRAPILAAA